MDANNLYGGIMQKFPLPLSEFEIMDVELSTILETANHSEIGFILEVDLDHTDALHNMHKDFPLARENSSQYVVRVSDASIGSSM